MLFQMAALKNSFSKIFQDFELRWDGFLEKFKYFFLEFRHILHLIENFKGYPNHYSHLTKLVGFNEKFQKYSDSIILASSVYIKIQVKLHNLLCKKYY